MSLDDLLDLRGTDWMRAALCAQTDPELWFPEMGGSSSAAKAVCARCPVLDDCREWALAQEDFHGICGGMSHRERIAERKRRGWWQVEPEHGTRTRYSKGCRCQPCAQANRDYLNAWAARRRAS